MTSKQKRIEAMMRIKRVLVRKFNDDEDEDIFLQADTSEDEEYIETQPKYKRMKLN